MVLVLVCAGAMTGYRRYHVWRYRARQFAAARAFRALLVDNQEHARTEPSARLKRWSAELIEYARREEQAHLRLAERPWEPHECLSTPTRPTLEELAAEVMREHPPLTRADINRMFDEAAARQKVEQANP